MLKEDKMSGWVDSLKADEVELHIAGEKCDKHLEPFETELMEYTSYVDTATIKNENFDQVKIVLKWKQWLKNFIIVSWHNSYNKIVKFLTAKYMDINQKTKRKY